MANWHDNVPAPVDSNGREVPLDTKKLVCRGETREVYCFIYNIGRGSWSVGVKGSCGSALSACTLPDSWERLEEDAAKELCEYFGHNDDDDDCYDCPAHNRGCIQFRSLDLVRRAKALAGVTDGE